MAFGLACIVPGLVFTPLAFEDSYGVTGVGVISSLVIGIPLAIVGGIMRRRSRLELEKRYSEFSRALMNGTDSFLYFRNYTFYSKYSYP